MSLISHGSIPGPMKMRGGKGTVPNLTGDHVAPVDDAPARVLGRGSRFIAHARFKPIALVRLELAPELLRPRIRPSRTNLRG